MFNESEETLDWEAYLSSQEKKIEQNLWSSIDILQQPNEFYPFSNLKSSRPPCNMMKVYVSASDIDYDNQLIRVMNAGVDEKDYYASLYLINSIPVVFGLTIDYFDSEIISDSYGKKCIKLILKGNFIDNNFIINYRDPFFENEIIYRPASEFKQNDFCFLHKDNFDEIMSNI